MKYTIFIFTLALLFNTSSVFAQQSQQNQNPPQAIPVNEQTLQPIQSTFNSQGFRPSASGAANSMSKCVGSAGVSGLVRSAISSFSGDQTRVPAQNNVLEGKDTGTIATSFISWDQLGWCLVNSLVESISAATVNWINSGFQGNPTFIDDPTTFFSNLADYQAGVFLNELSGGFLCRPIQNIVRVNIAQSYNRSISPFNQRAQCTFSGSVENMERFMSGGNFSWNNWLSFTQNPYNNPMGASIYSGIELDRRIAAELGVEKTLLDWGSGFFSSRDKETGKITSPGTVIETQINERLFSGQRRLEIADEFDEVVNALVNQLIKMAVSEMTQSGSGGSNYNSSASIGGSGTSAGGSTGGGGLNTSTGTGSNTTGQVTLFSPTTCTSNNPQVCTNESNIGTSITLNWPVDSQYSTSLGRLVVRSTDSASNQPIINRTIPYSSGTYTITDRLSRGRYSIEIIFEQGAGGTQKIYWQVK